MINLERVYTTVDRYIPFWDYVNFIDFYRDATLYQFATGEIANEDTKIMQVKIDKDLVMYYSIDDDYLRYGHIRQNDGFKFKNRLDLAYGKDLLKKGADLPFGSDGKPSYNSKQDYRLGVFAINDGLKERLLRDEYLEDIVLAIEGGTPTVNVLNMLAKEKLSAIYIEELPSFLNYHLERYKSDIKDFLENLIEITSEIWNDNSMNSINRKKTVRTWLNESFEMWDLNPRDFLTVPQEPSTPYIPQFFKFEPIEYQEFVSTVDISMRYNLYKFSRGEYNIKYLYDCECVKKEDEQNIRATIKNVPPEQIDEHSHIFESSVFFEDGIFKDKPKDETEPIINGVVVLENLESLSHIEKLDRAYSNMRLSHTKTKTQFFLYKIFPVNNRKEEDICFVLTLIGYLRQKPTIHNSKAEIKSFLDYHFESFDNGEPLEFITHIEDLGKRIIEILENDIKYLLLKFIARWVADSNYVIRNINPTIQSWVRERKLLVKYQQTSTPEPPPLESKKLTLTGKKVTIYHIFKQLIDRKFIGENAKEVAQFLIQNVNGFENDDINTLSTEISRNRETNLEKGTVGISKENRINLD